MPVTSRRPLFLTADPALLGELQQLAAAAGVEPDVASDPAGAVRHWPAAPLIVVGPDLLEALTAVRLPRRDGVVLVGEDLDDAGVWQRACALGAAHVVFLPDAAGWLCQEIAKAADDAVPEGPLIAVVGGRGGAGATTLACALGVTAARSRRRAMLIDGDPLGGGIDLVFGAENAGGLRWPDLSGARGRLPRGALDTALPQVNDLTVLSWDRGDALGIPPVAMEAVLGSERRRHELVIVDLPRTVDDCTRVVLGQASLVLLVATADVRAAAAASRVAASLGLLVRDLRLVVRGPSPSGLSATRIAETLGLPLVGELAPEPGLRDDLERGEAPARRGRGPLAELSRQVLDRVLLSGGSVTAA